MVSQKSKGQCQWWDEIQHYERARFEGTAVPELPNINNVGLRPTLHQGIHRVNQPVSFLVKSWALLTEMASITNLMRSCAVEGVEQ